MKEILFFETMLTPKVITFVYWLLLLFVALTGLGTMFGIIGEFSFGNFLYGIFIVVGGAVAARIWCELLMVMFKIHENIKKLAER